uniref:C-type lectin domain-containing protein n=1 Tax=Panagrolaimus davidi TaxID=227884 RepID=A0A914P7T3_9BILA
MHLFFSFDKFNGQLPIIYKSYDEATEVMKRYFWWSESDMNVKQIRFGMTHRHRDKPEIYDYTFFNPLQYMGVDVDMAIWNRSFPDPDPKNITLTYEMYDDENFNRTDVGPENDKLRYWEYMSLNPSNMKWSNANYRRKIPFVCEVPRFPKAFCEDGWWLHMKSRSCFKLVENETNFIDAAMNCRALKSNLASINDETENHLAIKMINASQNVDGKDGPVLQGKNNKVWFGLRHDALKAHNNAEAPADKKSPEYAKYFQEYLGFNVDGTPTSDFTYFGTGQPDGFNYNGGQRIQQAGMLKENCFVFEEIQPDGGDKKREWHDYPCMQTMAWSFCRKMASSQPYPKT